MAEAVEKLFSRPGDATKIPLTNPSIPLLLRPCHRGTFSAVSSGFRTQNRSTANQFYIVETNGEKNAPPVVVVASSLGARKRDCASRVASTEDRAVGSTQWASG